MNRYSRFVHFAALLLCLAAISRCPAQIDGFMRSYSPNSTGQQFEIEIEELPTFNEVVNSPLNDEVTVDVGEVLGTDEFCFTDIAWDVTFETIGNSFDTEAAFLFTGNDKNAWFLTVGTLGAPTPPGGMNYAGGFVNLAENGLPIICPTDGNIDIQFFELFNDNPGEPDALLFEDSELLLGINGDGMNIESTVIVRFVPEPAVAVLLLPLLLIYSLRRRRH